MVALNSPGKREKFDEMSNSYRPVRFENFRLKLDLDDPVDKEIDKILQVHSGNMANGGRMFRAQSLEEEAMISKVEKGTFAKIPDEGLNEKEKRQLNLLVKVSENVKGFAKADILKALNTVQKALSVVGLPKYSDKSTAKSLGATATVMLDILEENNISYGRETDTGAGSSTS